MIIDILSNLIFWLVDIVCFFLPNWRLPDFVIDAFNQVMPYIVLLVTAFPFLQALVVCFLLLMTFRIMVTVANLVFGFLALIRGSGKPEV